MDSKVSKKLDKFFSQFKLLHFKKGEILIQADENPGGAIYLIEGVVRSYALSPTGEELTINTFKPFSFFPMPWVFNDSPNSYFYEAMTQVRVFKAPKDQTKAFLKNNSDVLFDLLQRIYRGLDGYMLRVEHLLGGTAYAKLLTEILILARRFGKKEKDKTVINLKITENDLAAQTGIARETVSRNLMEIKKNGLIDFKNNQLIVYNIDKLKRALLES